MTFIAASVQMEIRERSPEINRQQVRAAVARAADDGAGMVVLPETWTAGFKPTVENPFLFAEEEDGPTVYFMRELAQKYGLHLIGGSIPERAEGNVYNTVYFFSPIGELIGKYRKINLFPYGERDSLKSGNELPVFDTKLGKVALMTCYDIRFPEIARHYALNGAEIIAVPSNFTVSISEDFPRSKVHHWAILLLARAIENQVFIISSNCTKGENKEYFGHSLIIDPWGEKLADAKTEVRNIYGEIDTDLIDKVRKVIPSLKDTRLY